MARKTNRTSTKRSTRKTAATSTRKTKAANGAAPASTKGSTLIPLKKICQELKLDPKAARVKLRKAELSFHDRATRWAFTAAQARKVKEILAA